MQASLPGAYGPWDDDFTSSLQKATAYEDHPLYDPADKAPFTKMTLTFNPNSYSASPNAYARAVFNVFWYRTNGTTAGSVTHEEFYVAWRNVPGWTGSTGACPIWFTTGT